MFQKVKKNYLKIFLSFLLLYFIINLLGGERGLISFTKKKNDLKNLKNEEKKLINKISDIEHKNSLLTDNLDLDYIEILIRDKFIYGKKGETTYIIKNNGN
tara:strand:- start:18 stop:320 length:303 start_codon:yes stop_codon:yes gene_type:complete